MIRYTPEEVEERRDGLDIRTLEIPRPLWPVLRFLRPWRRMRVAKSSVRGSWCCVRYRPTSQNTAA